MTLQERITELLEAHRPHMVMWWQGCTCMDGQDNPGWSPQRHDEHLADLFAAAAEEHYRPRIELPEQLDELPAGTVIKIGESEGGLYERDRSGYWGYAPWRGEAQTIVADARHEEQSIRVLWSPGAGE